MNYKDVALLNSSLDQLGDTLLKQRMIDEQVKERAASQAIASRRTDIDAARMAAEQTHYNNMETKGQEGTVNTWLGTDDGGILNFHGPKAAMDALVQKSAAAGKPLKVVPQPKTPAPYADISKTLPDGSTIRFHTRTQDEANNVMDTVSKLPSAPRPGFNTKETANTKARESELAKAKDLRDQAASESDATSAERQVMLQQADQIEKNAYLNYPQAGATKPDRTVSVADKVGDQTVTQRFTPGEFQQYQQNNLPAAPTDPKLRKTGGRYKLPNGNIGVWQGTGWQVQQPAQQ